MGNSESFHIELENSNAAHTAGEPLRGTVLVRTGRPLPKDGTLSLWLYGKEKVVIPSGAGTNQGDSPSRAERLIFSHHAQVHCRDARSVSSARGAVGASVAAFLFLFEIPLPSELPATSSHHPRGGGSRGAGFRLQYKLRAKLGSHRKDVPVVILGSAAEPRPRVPRHLPPTALPVPGAGVVAPRDDGDAVVTLAARLDDAHLRQGDELSLKWACVCRSSQAGDRIKGVEIRLVECLRWRTSWHEHRELRELVSVRTAEDDAIVAVLEEVESPSIHQTIGELLGSVRNRVTFAVPESARDSYHGHIIHCWHVVEIRLLLRGSDPGDGPSRSLKVCIGTHLPPDQAVLVSHGDATVVAASPVVATTAPTPPVSPTSVVVVGQDPLAGVNDPSSTSAAPWACAVPLTDDDDFYGSAALRYARVSDGS